MKILWILAAAATFAACHNRSDDNMGAAPDRGDSTATSGYDTTAATPRMKSDTTMTTQPNRPSSDSSMTQPAMPSTDSTQSLPSAGSDTTSTAVPSTGTDMNNDTQPQQGDSAMTNPTDSASTQR